MAEKAENKKYDPIFKSKGWYVRAKRGDGESNSKNIEEQLKIGIIVEKEHKNVWEKLVRKFGENKLPFNENEFYKLIAKAHIEEMPESAPLQYYTGLDILEKFMKSLINDNNAQTRISAFKDMVERNI